MRFDFLALMKLEVSWEWSSQHLIRTNDDCIWDKGEWGLIRKGTNTPELEEIVITLKAFDESTGSASTADAQAYIRTLRQCSNISKLYSRLFRLFRIEEVQKLWNTIDIDATRRAAPIIVRSLRQYLQTHLPTLTDLNMEVINSTTVYKLSFACFNP